MPTSISIKLAALHQEADAKEPIRRLSNEANSIESGPKRRKREAQVLNPKTALFFYAFLPQFVDPARGGVEEQILLFGVLFVLLASCTDCLYALLSSMVGNILSRNGHIWRVQRYVTGSVYIVLGVTTAIVGSEKK
jgi:threonine/homoserine/homoserine lactone efflux protein